MNESYEQLAQEFLAQSANTRKQGEFVTIESLQASDSLDTSAGCSGVCQSGSCRAGFI